MEGEVLDLVSFRSTFVAEASLELWLQLVMVFWKFRCTVIDVAQRETGRKFCGDGGGQANWRLSLADSLTVPR